MIYYLVGFVRFGGGPVGFVGRAQYLESQSLLAMDFVVPAIWAIHSKAGQPYKVPGVS